MGLLLSTRRALIGSVGVVWVPTLPLPDSGLLPEHWYRSDQGLWQDAGITPAAADGDVVGRWEDISANADHVNQAVVASKPTLQNGAGDLLNGHPVVRFDGINDYLQGAFTTGGALAQPFTILAVAMLNPAGVNVGGTRMLTDGDDGVNRCVSGQYGTPSPDEWYIYGGTILASGSASDSNWNIWTNLYNGLTSRFWHNGIAQCAVGNAGAHNPDGLTVGTSNAGGNPWYGDAAEFIVYDANLSDADKNTIGTYLASRYALAYTDI